MLADLLDVLEALVVIHIPYNSVREGQPIVEVDVNKLRYEHSGVLDQREENFGPIDEELQACNHQPRVDSAPRHPRDNEWGVRPLEYPKI